jgi:hypothetical protein
MIFGWAEIFQVRLERYDGENMIGKYVSQIISTKLNQHCPQPWKLAVQCDKSQRMCQAALTRLGYSGLPRLPL